MVTAHVSSLPWCKFHLPWQRSFTNSSLVYRLYSTAVVRPYDRVWVRHLLVLGCSRQGSGQFGPAEQLAWRAFEQNFRSIASWISIFQIIYLKCFRSFRLCVVPRQSSGLSRQHDLGGYFVYFVLCTCSIYSDTNARSISATTATVWTVTAEDYFCSLYSV